MLNILLYVKPCNCVLVVICSSGPTCIYSRCSNHLCITMQVPQFDTHIAKYSMRILPIRYIEHSPRMWWVYKSFFVPINLFSCINMKVEFKYHLSTQDVKCTFVFLFY